LNEIIREVLRLLDSDLLGAPFRRDATRSKSSDGGCRPGQFATGVANLLMNSIEAMQPKPAAKRRILISTRCEADSVVTSVRDYGGGLPKDNPDKIFTHFYSTKPDGMGMGLTMFRSIVEAHGGKLGAENADQGARFFFSLPVAAKKNGKRLRERSKGACLRGSHFAARRRLAGPQHRISP